MQNKAAKKKAFIEAHVSAPGGMLFYTALDPIINNPGLLGYLSTVKRAWNILTLDGLLFQDGRPVLYLKESKSLFSSSNRLRLQRLFWNQGVANILVLADATHVYIYSGLAKPLQTSPDEAAEESNLVEILKKADYIQTIQSFYHALSTGAYYESHRNRFHPDQAVDSQLLQNLREFRNCLIKGNDKLDIRQVHSFIGRVLFLCYLLDREIVTIQRPMRGEKTGTTLFIELLESLSFEKRLDYLYDLFHDLKERFNGNMFDQDLDSEKHLIQRDHLDSLVFFLGGHDMKTGQRSLGFWPYDFKMIPVETISAIYQDFLGTEDPNQQRKKGAFYTPRFLAEMVVDMAVRNDPDLLDGSFLDPACGSGIFLVILFNRIANRRFHGKTTPLHYSEKAKELQAILSHQIRGIDLEETACRIASFSLYLAYLDFFDPPDIQEYVERTGQPLPKLLNYGNNSESPGADIPVIHKADFLAGEMFSGETFGCIVGNPPWEGRGSRQLAQKFLEKTPEYLEEKGVGCLLLPTKILQNQTDTFQYEWLLKVRLERVVQLADYSFLLFQNAKAPAFIARFKNEPPQPHYHRIEFAAPKFNREGIRRGVITVNPSDRTWISLANVLEATQAKTAPVVWKRRLWGTDRDQKLLDLLQYLPQLSKLAGNPDEGKRWIKGQGFQPYYSFRSENDSNYPKPKPNHWDLDHKFIRTSKNVHLFLFEPDLITLGEEIKRINASATLLRRAPNSNLFKAPMLLVSQGFGRIAFSDTDVLFQHSLQAIAGPPEDAELLMFLAAYLRSGLAKYFLFHTAANWGSERDKVHLNELLRIPFPLPGEEFISEDAERIIDKTVRKMIHLRNDLENLYNGLISYGSESSIPDEKWVDIREKWNKERKKRVDALQTEIEPLIYQYFNLTEQEIALVEDTNRIFIPSSTPSTWRSAGIKTLDPVEKARAAPYDREGLAAYADMLTNTLNHWAAAEDSEYRVQSEGGTDKDTGLAMVTLTLCKKEEAFRLKAFSRQIFETVKRLYEHSAQERGSLYYNRDILFFQGEQIHIIRPNILMNWTRTGALNDASRIYGDIALFQETS